MTRVGRRRRETTETSIEVTLDLEGRGEGEVRTGVPFFDHMLAHLAKHGRIDLQVKASGDLAVDPHHTVEDVGIVLGQAFRSAVGDGRGIARFGAMPAPMDEALVLAALDVSGRPYLHYGLSVEREVVGTFATDLAEEFFRAFATHAAVTLHLVQLQGRNPHHILEAAFKGTGIALHQATRIVGGDVPSTKGVLGP
ncbi:MAG: imidazoleglycerol-phosphate dehydratase HisB [Armatimonadetes bacterium]|nr:imidazoleglycerol-phosphate dehydratase HisB [Armatimonadota bacterium]